MTDESSVFSPKSREYPKRDIDWQALLESKFAESALVGNPASADFLEQISEDNGLRTCFPTAVLNDNIFQVFMVALTSTLFSQFLLCHYPTYL